MVSAGVTATDVLAAIREIAARELLIYGEILPAHELIGDLELDSISLVTMLAAIENRFRVQLPPADAGTLQTVQHVIEHVVARAKERQT